jgi:hypothetical protein
MAVPQPPFRWRRLVGACLRAAGSAGLVLAASCTGDPDVVAAPMDAGSADARGLPTGDAATEDPCDLDRLLDRAGIPPEGIIVAATCQLPVSWLDMEQPVDVGSQDLRELLKNSGPITPSTDTLTGQLLCNGDFNGLWYYDNPFQPTTILLCPDLCEFVRSAVSNRIEDLGCESGLEPDGGRRDRPFPFPEPRPRPDAGNAAPDGSADGLDAGL